MPRFDVEKLSDTFSLIKCHDMTPKCLVFRHDWSVVAYTETLDVIEF